MPQASFNPPDGKQPDLSGRRLGDFQILRRLGRGAMAEVYLAEQASLRRQVAIKVLKQELAKDAAYVQRFQHEARAVASLTHANIVQIHDVGQQDGIHYIAQEYVSGRNLGQLIERSGSIDVKLAVAIMRQVAAALHKAAEQGIVHRDIKPENIMLARTGEVKVADFGLARMQGGDGLHLTQVGMTIGTPLYMAPEQIEGKPVDCRSDLYSFGVTAYHMLAGHPPFRGETALAVAVQHLNSAAVPLEQLRPDLPAGLCRIVHRLMAKQAADRYPSARELLQDLRSLQIDGASAEWADDLDWSTAEMVALTDRRTEATQQLQTVMNAGTRVEGARPKLRWFIAACAAALGIGVLAAAMSRPDPLLADAQFQKIPQRDSAWRQLYHAKMVDTEAAWLSVEKHYPDNRFAVPLAKQGLVRYYLWQSLEYQKALPLLDELAASNETETSLRSFALAGRCVALSMLGQQEPAREQFNQLTSNMIDQLDPRMRRTLESLMARNRAALTRDATENLRRLQEQIGKE